MPWRRHKRHRRRTMTCGLLLAALGITSIPAGWLWHRTPAGRLPSARIDHGDQAGESQLGPFAGLNPDSASAGCLRRPVYPYSVIPGGVESIAELRQALLGDPVAAGHYLHFDISGSRLQELPAEKMAYVSYRIKDRVFWTSRKVRLPQGEKVITDGVNYARARCGNRISEVPQTPSHPGPPPEELDTPLIFSNRTLIVPALNFTPLPAELVPPEVLSETASFVPPPGFITGASLPPVPRGSTPGPPPRSVINYGPSPPMPRHRPGCPYPLLYPGAPCRPFHPPPTVVPEPGTVLLISTGLGLMALRGRRRSAPSAPSGRQ